MGKGSFIVLILGVIFRILLKNLSDFFRRGAFWRK